MISLLLAHSLTAATPGRASVFFGASAGVFSTRLRTEDLPDSPNLSKKQKLENATNDASARADKIVQDVLAQLSSKDNFKDVTAQSPDLVDQVKKIGLDDDVVKFLNDQFAIDVQARTSGGRDFPNWVVALDKKSNTLFVNLTARPEIVNSVLKQALKTIDLTTPLKSVQIFYSSDVTAFTAGVLPQIPSAPQLSEADALKVINLDDAFKDELKASVLSGTTPVSDPVIAKSLYKDNSAFSQLFADDARYTYRNSATNAILAAYLGASYKFPNSPVGIGALLEGSYAFGEKLLAKSVLGATDDKKNDILLGIGGKLLVQLRFFLSEYASVAIEGGFGLQRASVNKMAIGLTTDSRDHINFCNPIIGLSGAMRMSKNVSLTMSARYLFANKRRLNKDLKGDESGNFGSLSGIQTTVGCCFDFPMGH